MRRAREEEMQQQEETVRRERQHEEERARRKQMKESQRKYAERAPHTAHQHAPWPPPLQEHTRPLAAQGQSSSSFLTGQQNDCETMDIDATGATGAAEQTFGRLGPSANQLFPSSVRQQFPSSSVRQQPNQLFPSQQFPSCAAPSRQLPSSLQQSSPSFQHSFSTSILQPEVSFSDVSRKRPGSTFRPEIATGADGYVLNYELCDAPSRTYSLQIAGTTSGCRFRKPDVFYSSVDMLQELPVLPGVGCYRGSSWLVPRDGTRGFTIEERRKIVSSALGSGRDIRGVLLLEERGSLLMTNEETSRIFDTLAPGRNATVDVQSLSNVGFYKYLPSPSSTQPRVWGKRSINEYPASVREVLKDRRQLQEGGLRSGETCPTAMRYRNEVRFVRDGDTLRVIINKGGQLARTAGC